MTNFTYRSKCKVENGARVGISTMNDVFLGFNYLKNKFNFLEVHIYPSIHHSHAYITHISMILGLSTERGLAL